MPEPLDNLPVINVPSGTPCNEEEMRRAIGTLSQNFTTIINEGMVTNTLYTTTIIDARTNVTIYENNTFFIDNVFVEGGGQLTMIVSTDSPDYLSTKFTGYSSSVIKDGNEDIDVQFDLVSGPLLDAYLDVSDIVDWSSGQYQFLMNDNGATKFIELDNLDWSEVTGWVDDVNQYLRHKGSDNSVSWVTAGACP